MWRSTGSKQYVINPTGNQKIRVYCDMETDGHTCAAWNCDVINSIWSQRDSTQFTPGISQVAFKCLIKCREN